MDHLWVILSVYLALFNLIGVTCGCRVNSELLESYTRETVERLLDVKQFESLYWPDEPLSASALAKATGINVTLAETHFSIDGLHNQNEVASEGNGTKHAAGRAVPSLIQDIFVSCSVSRDRSYALSINLELDNPFKTIEFHYDIPKSLQSRAENGRQFRISLPQSTFLVQLNQRIRYDECLTINNVQLSPSVNYEIDCTTCDDQERAYLDNAFNKRMTQFDAELDALISEKLLLGLQVLLNQQQLELY